MRTISAIASAILISSSCASGPRVAAPVPSDANARFDALAEAYFEELLQVEPTLGTSIGDNRYNDRFAPGFIPEQRERERALAEKTLAALAKIDRAALDENRAISHEILERTLKDELEGLRFPSHLIPVDQFRNFANFFAQMGAGTGIHPFKTVKDYDDFLSRMTGFAAAVDVAIANMRQGVAAGVVQPRVLMEQVLPQLAAHVVTRPEESVYFKPIQAMPAFPQAERDRLTGAYTAAIRDALVPAYQRLHDFIRDEYLPKTRATVALSALPDGRAWYEHTVRHHTTTDLSPEQIHEIGLAEVERIHSEMEMVRQQVGFRGHLPAFMRHVATSPSLMFKSREEMLAEYRATQARIDASTDKLFDVKPTANYEIRPVEPFREKSASGGSYVAATPDGSRPGVFYLNTYEPTKRSKTAVESLLLHEGSPGHHFQISIQRELTSLPRFRRFGRFTVYSEGWGLYAESLGKELGFYTDPYRYFGALQAELWRSVRLVLDTGIHTKGWTRERAIDYARQNSAATDVQIVSEVERFIAMPGQALAYKMGELKISELRRRAERAMGPRFDVKAFHRAVLESGAVPLDVLERRIDRWISSGSAPAAGLAPRLDALFDDLHARGLFDGAAVVGTAERVLWAKGYGLANVEKSARFTPDTPSDGGSLAKTFTASLLLSLARDGVVDLDAPGQRLLPELPYPTVTLRHLLSHSSEIPVADYDYFDPFLPPPHVRTTQALLSVIEKQKPKLAFAPGTAFAYSSFGFDLAALAARRAVGKEYQQQLAERFFGRLGITSAFARPARLAEFPGVRTVGYRRTDGGLSPNEVFDFEAFHGGSNVYISALDLHRWNASFLSRSDLHPADALTPARIGASPSGLTLGSWYWSADGSAHWYSGHLQGFHSEVFRDLRAGWSIVYVSNNTMEPWLQKALVRAVHAILSNREPEPLVPPAADEVARADYRLLAGTWELPDTESLGIELSSDHLEMRRDRVAYRMVQIAKTAFYVPGLDYVVAFRRGSEGAFSQAYVSSNLTARTAVRRRSGN